MLRGRIKRAEVATNKLPLLGKIKVGIKGDKYPKSLDYFVADGKYSGLFKEQFEGQPKIIPIVFISDDPAVSCNERYECRDAQGRLAGYGDGEMAYLFDAKSDEYEPFLVSENRDKIKSAGKWETILTIRFIIPKIRTVFGQWQFSTKGDKSSIPAIRDTFDAVMETAGTVRNIPFDLIVEKVKSQKPNSKSLFPVVTLVPNISKTNLESLANYIQSGNDIKKLGQLNNQVIEGLSTDTKMIGDNNSEY